MFAVWHKDRQIPPKSDIASQEDAESFAVHPWPTMRGWIIVMSCPNDGSAERRRAAYYVRDSHCYPDIAIGNGISLVF